GIQAIDLVGRKLARDGGIEMRALIAGMRTTVEAARKYDGGQYLAARLDESIEQLSAATKSLVSAMQRDRMAAPAVASPHLGLVGTVVGGWLLTQSAMAARRRRTDAAEDGDYLAVKEGIARFYAANLLPQAAALAAAVLSGGDTALALTEDQF